MTRYVQPCLICGDENHQTSHHGKDQYEIYQQLRSRKLNPRDPLFDKELWSLLPQNRITC
jgi:hypothetical protein